MGGIPRNETCRNSHRGILDAFVESPWSKRNYMSYLTWEVHRHPAGWTDEEHAQHEHVITGFDKKEAATEKEEDNVDKDAMEEILKDIKESGKDGDILDKDEMEAIL